MKPQGGLAPSSRLAAGGRGRLAAGGQQTGLAQTAAGHLADATGALDQCLRTAQRRAHWRAEPLAEADREAVEMVGDLAQAGERALPRRGLILIARVIIASYK